MSTRECECVVLWGRVGSAPKGGTVKLERDNAERLQKLGAVQIISEGDPEESIVSESPDIPENTKETGKLKKSKRDAEQEQAPILEEFRDADSPVIIIPTDEIPQGADSPDLTPIIKKPDE